MNTKPHSREWKFVAAVILACIGICAASVWLIAERSLSQAERSLRKTATYMKTQCATYTLYNDGAETQALLRAAESNLQTRDSIYESFMSGQPINEELLLQCAQKLWLHGIVLLDADGKIECSYAENKQTEAALMENFAKEISYAGSDTPERLYTQRIYFSDSSYINMAASAREDADGIILTYYSISAECARSYSLTLQSLLNGYRVSVDGTIIVTDEGKVIASNDEALIGQSASDNSIIQELKSNAGAKNLTHVKKNGCYGLMLKQRDYYIYAYLPDKTIFASLPQNISVVMMLYGCLILVIWLMTQKSERERRSAEAENDRHYREMLLESAKKADAANVAKTEFLQRMSHDIRTPINGICGMLEVADYYADDLDRQAECREKIRDASHLLLELVNEILDMGKLESGEVVLEAQPFNLHEVIDEVLVVIERISSEQGLKLTYEKSNLTHWQLIGSARHVKRMLMNIMSNAVKYNKKNGSISFSCRELPANKEGEAIIEFICKDTGIGMSSEYQQKIFEPFTQENTEIQSKYGGSGLGMSIAKGLVDKMDGSLTFESEPGVGTTFVVRIPFKINESAEITNDRSGEKEQYSIENYHILLAEDNELNMEIAEFILETEGAVVTKAYNGQEAADIFEKSAPGEFDAILMDVMMPKMDGYQTAKTIRAMDRADAKSIPIIAMTANAFTEDRIQAREAGMNAHISKPLDSKLVIKTVNRLVQAVRRDGTVKTPAGA